LSNTHKIDCPKCEGTGFLSHYRHIANGECFHCQGKGFKLLTDKQYQAYQEELTTVEERQQYYEDQIRKQREEEERQREIEEEKKQQNIEKYQEKLSFYGEVGEKIKLTLNEKFNKMTRYGVFYVLEDEYKRQFTFNAKDHYFVLHGQFEIEATIKEHKEYNGYKQTVLKNVKVLNHIELSELSDEEIDQLPI
jgi:hypothetical protein